MFGGRRRRRRRQRGGNEEGELERQMKAYAEHRAKADKIYRKRIAGWYKHHSPY